VKYEAASAIASQPSGQSKPRLFDRVLRPAGSLKETDCNASPLHSIGYESVISVWT